MPRLDALVPVGLPNGWRGQVAAVARAKRKSDNQPVEAFVNGVGWLALPAWLVDGPADRRNQGWLGREIVLLHRLRNKGLRNGQIGTVLRRGRASISNYMSTLGLTNAPRRWTDAQLANLAARAGRMPWAKVSEEVGHTPEACKTKAYRERLGPRRL